MSIPQKLLKEDGYDERSRMWRNMDINGNGIVSVAEIDKRLIEKASMDKDWQNVAKYKQSIRMALNAADINNSGFIEGREFRLLLVYLDFYSRAQSIFNKIDSNNDHRIDYSEFQKAAHILGVESCNLQTEFHKIDINQGGQILFNEFCIWLAQSTYPDIDQFQDQFKVEKKYKNYGEMNEFHEIPNKPKVEHQYKTFKPKLNNIDNHLSQHSDLQYGGKHNHDITNDYVDSMNLYTSSSPKRSPELQFDSTEYYTGKNPYQNMHLNEKNQEVIVQTLAPEEYPIKPSGGRRLSQDLKIGYKQKSNKHSLQTRSKLPSNTKPDERRIWEYNKRIYEALDKDILADITLEPEMQEKLDQLMEELNIDTKQDVQKSGKTQSIYQSTVPENQIKKRSRRMSAAMRDYKQTKYKPNWQHSGMVNK